LKPKTFLTPFLVLIGLVAATTSAYFLGNLFPDVVQVSTPGMPPLSPLDLPSQTMNGITAQLESYYADASRLVFVVRVNSEKGKYFLDSASIKEANGEEINAGYGVGPYLSPSTFMIDFVTAQPLAAEHLNGRLAFNITEPGDWTPLANFQFDLDIPVHPELTLNPEQSVWANGIEILLDRVVITPAYTNAYLCYIEPTDADWVIGQDTTLSIDDSPPAHLGTYGLLFDKSLGDGSKGGEPGWTPPVQDGRCVKVGFPVGGVDPKSLTLTIPALEQSTPEVIPEGDLEFAYVKLKEQGIDMEWHTVDHGAYPEYRSLPLGMSEEEAYRQLIKALGYTHPGPWIFELSLHSQEENAPKFSTSSYGAPTPLPAPSRTEPVAKLDGRIHSFDLRADEKAIAFATSKGVVVYDFAREKIRVLDEDKNFFGIDWSQDGKKLAASGLVMQDIEIGQPYLAVWNVSDWRVIFEPTYKEYMSDTLNGNVVWSPDDRMIAAGNGYIGVTTYNVETGKVVSEQDIFSGMVADISWSPDGSRLIATGDMAYGIRRWRLGTNESVRLFDQRASSSMALAWSPDGKRIASGHGGGTVCFWTASTNECDGLIYAHDTATFSVAWAPDGSQLATGGGVIRVWDSQTGEQLSAFGLHETSIYKKLVWTKPDRLISLQTGYGTKAMTIVRFWDLQTGKVLMEFHGGLGELWQ
jgi:WD40 repeat protein